jgi:putative FmdB family regulatory protein
MPIFEYRCTDCQHLFEAIQFGAAPPHCPVCDGVRLQKQLSVFAVNTRSAGVTRSEAVGPCGTCGDLRGPGSCSLN